MQAATTPDRSPAGAAAPRTGSHSAWTAAPGRGLQQDSDSLMALLCAEVRAFTAVLTK